jgi:putative nucleotidyltransferase with HDIG domain
MARVLVVDDERGLRETMALFLEKEGHSCAKAQDVQSALDAVAAEPFDVVVSDIVMPGRDGLDLLRVIREATPRSHVILVTGEPSVDTASEAVRAGAFDYLAKPVSRSRLCNAVLGAARLKQAEDEAVTHRENLERLVEDRTRSLRDTVEKLQATLRNTIEVLSRAMETRDPYTAGHQRRVTNLACAIGESLGLPDAGISALRSAGLVHDIGKLSVPAEILAKPARLTKAEFDIVRAHSVTGFEILAGLDFGAPVADMVRQHHERLDGSGYPDGLAADGILVESRILAVADVVEAMSSHRPYRPALGLDVALAEIGRGKGIIFDSEAVDACTGLLRGGGFTLEK